MTGHHPRPSRSISDQPRYRPGILLIVCQLVLPPIPIHVGARHPPCLTLQGKVDHVDAVAGFPNRWGQPVWWSCLQLGLHSGPKLVGEILTGQATVSGGRH